MIPDHEHQWTVDSYEIDDPFLVEYSVCEYQAAQEHGTGQGTSPARCRTGRAEYFLPSSFDFVGGTTTVLDAYSDDIEPDNCVAATEYRHLVVAARLEIETHGVAAVARGDGADTRRIETKMR
jgi:hypothetical protein